MDILGIKITDFRWLIFGVLLLFGAACSFENDDELDLSGEWYCLMEVTFGEPGSAFAHFNFEMPYAVSIQGRGTYEGPDGIGSQVSLAGLVSGWIEHDQFVFYFVEEQLGKFTLKMNGEQQSGGILTGHFNAFLRDESWFSGIFTASREEHYGTRPHPSPIRETGPESFFSGNDIGCSHQKYTSAQLSDGDTVLIFEDFENQTDWRGVIQSEFSHDGHYSAFWEYPQTQSIVHDLPTYEQDWSSYTRLELWLWSEQCHESAWLRLQLSVAADETDTISVHSYDLPLSRCNRWWRYVIYFEDFQPELPVTGKWWINRFEVTFIGPEEPERPFAFHLDQILLRDDLWFFPIVFQNGYIRTNFDGSAALEQALADGKYGTAVRMLNQYFREYRELPHYDEPWTGFTVEQNNCYLHYRCPFPPYSCNSDATSFSNAENNYTVDWLRWENYGRYQVDDADTRYLYWQWSGVFNRHYLLSQLAAGVAYPGQTDSEGIEISEQDRFKWSGVYTELLSDWIYDFPDPSFCTGWGEPAFTVLGDIATAIRTEHWFKMMELLGEDYQTLPAWLYWDCLKLLYRQGELLAQDIMLDWNPNNHTALLGFTLYGSALLYPEFWGAGPIWRDLGIQAVDNMSFNDGGHKEGSTHYQKLTLNFINHYFELAQLNDPEGNHGYLAELDRISSARMKMHLYYWGIVKPPCLESGGTERQHFCYTVPAINDGVGLGIDVTQFMDWLFDPENGIEVPTSYSVYFPDIGQMVMRSGRAPDDIYLLFDSGPFGSGAHGHQDKLSFVLAAYGRTLLCDPGGWGGSNQDWDRSAMHNTVTIDDYGQIRPYENGYSTNYEDNKWFSSDTMVRAEGVYSGGYGYFNDNEPICLNQAQHQRSIEFHKQGGQPYFVVADTIGSADNHPHWLKIYFHFHPEEARTADELQISDQVLSSVAGHIAIEATSGTGSWSKENRLVQDSHLYGNVRLAAVAYYTVHSVHSETEIEFKITPYP